jgi:Ca2+-binding RTX toxin-like protein
MSIPLAIWGGAGLDTMQGGDGNDTLSGCAVKAESHGFA